MGDYRVGDCLELLKEVGDGSVEVEICSPPYNQDIKYSEYKDNLTEEEYLIWMGKVFEELYRVLDKDGHFFLQLGGTCKDPLKPFRVLERAQRLGFHLQNQIIWVKSIAMGDRTHGHFKPVNSKRYLNHLYEYIFHLTKDGAQELDRLALGVPYMDKTNIDRLGGVKRDLRCRGNLWFLPYETVAQAKDHPAAFPLEIPLWCLELSGKKGLVLDPFCGSGTTLMAADQLGNESIGMDLDQSYKEIYEKRVRGKRYLWK